jgi:alkanesulfonate monooxygenase SsuD/methylene tetrahydromethanopterin reductase-like flavin-dependent oxidoreductase (luciferase family)
MFREALEHVELADRLGFDYMWPVEHNFLEDHALSSAPEVWLGAVAGRTRRIRIGHGIVCMPPGFSHPARVAERIATLDQVSGGRVDFGTGESSSRMELEGFGVDVTTKRCAYLEALEQTCNMMTMSPYPGYEGEFFSMPCRNIVPKPAQKPHPPLWVAGKPDVAAQLGMGCPGFNVVGGKQAKVMVDQYYRTLVEQSVPIGHAVNANIAVLATMHCHEDAEVAQRNGEHLKFFGYTIGKYYLDGNVRPGRSNSWEEFLSVKDQFPDMGDSPTQSDRYTGHDPRAPARFSGSGGGSGDADAPGRTTRPRDQLSLPRAVCARGDAGVRRERGTAGGDQSRPAGSRHRGGPARKKYLPTPTEIAALPSDLGRSPEATAAEAA